jgi:hypothetical protein
MSLVAALRLPPASPGARGRQVSCHGRLPREPSVTGRRYRRSEDNRQHPTAALRRPTDRRGGAPEGEPQLQTPTSPRSVRHRPLRRFATALRHLPGNWSRPCSIGSLAATAWYHPRANYLLPKHQPVRVAGPRTLRLRRSQITPCSTLGFLCFTRIAPHSTSSALCRPPI